jgi:choline dehydrogenase-like flavoprotein
MTDSIWTEDILSRVKKASDIGAGQVLGCDVLVVGSGAGGGNAAEIFAKAGLKVILIDEGPLKTKKDFKMDEGNAYMDLYQDGGGRVTLDNAIKILQGRCVGGGTTVNWTSSFRTPHETLKHWLKEHGLSFTSKNMAPWFDQVEERYSISRWNMQPNKNNQSIKFASDKMGWSHDVLKRNVNNCANLGYCGLGCPINAKQSTLITAIPNAIRKGTMLITMARAQKIETQGDKALAVECNAVDNSFSKSTEHNFKIQAKHIVLAAGGIGTPAVLLRTKETDEKVDPYDLVGKRTFIHPVCGVIGFLPYKVRGEYGAPQSLYSDYFLNGRMGDRIGFKLEVAPIQPSLTATAIEGHGKEHFNIMTQRQKASNMIALMRDGFHPESTGGQVIMNKYGLPKLDYPMTPYVWEGIKTSIELMSKAFFEIGATEVLPLHKDAIPIDNFEKVPMELSKLAMEKHKVKLFSAHVMGGCQMGKEAHNSVIDENGKHHEFQNLWVMDGSIFPTSIGANPMESILGFSQRFATQLANKIRG